MLNWFKKRPKKPVDASRMSNNPEVNTSTNQYFIQEHSIPGQSKMFKNTSEKKHLEDTFSKTQFRESDDESPKNENILEELRREDKQKGSE